MKKIFYRLIFDRRLAVQVLAIILLMQIISVQSKAANEAHSSDLMIEMELKADPYASNRQRRTDWSKRFSLGLENFMPEKYVSPVDQSKYSELVGTNSLQMTALNIGTQYNTRIGGFYFDTFYAIGSTSGTSNGITTTLGANKYGASFGLFLDTIFENPWMSPYASYQIFSMDWREVAPGMSVNTGGNISMMSSYQIGLSLYLDKVDPLSARDAYAEYGLKNSYIDVFGVQSLKSSNSTDPDMSTAFNWGINFRLEF